jgi:chromosome partitioning protein
LLIDLDPQANLTLSLGLKPDELRCTANDALFGVRSLVSVSRESTVFGLDIVPANQGLALVEKVLHGRQGYEFRLRNQMRALDDRVYDVVLIDCPSHLGSLTMNALTAVDLLVVPVQCDYYSAHSLRQTVGLVRRVRERTNPHLSYRVLVTLYDRRNRICRAVLSQMQRDLSPVLLQTVIEVDTRLRESPAYGRPITLYAPHTRSAQQYRTLAKELISDGRKRRQSTA